jgi:hypothetical protein
VSINHNTFFIFKILRRNNMRLYTRRQLSNFLNYLFEIHGINPSKPLPSDPVHPPVNSGNPDTPDAPEEPEKPSEPSFPKGGKCPVNVPLNVRWRGNRVSVAIDTNLPASEKKWIRVALSEAIIWVHSVCDLRITLNDTLQTRAGIFITEKSIDGAGKTLGQARQWISAGFFTRVHIEHDKVDIRDDKIRVMVFKHEFGHAIGFPHAPEGAPKTLMSAFLSFIPDYGEFEEKLASKLY